MRGYGKLVIIVLLMVLAAVFLLFPKPTQEPEFISPQKELTIEGNMEIQSPAFENNQLIPSKYTCDGENINPPLEIKEPPEGTKAFVLIVDDPDAPAGTWVHWTLWNIAPETTQIDEASIPPGATEGMTDFGSPGYGGPCPPSGTHRYRFKLYALDMTLNLDSSSGKEEVEGAMGDHILEEALLKGLYRRQ